MAVYEDKRYVIKDTLYKFCCQLCEHVWIPRNPEREPHKCPRCQSFDWRGKE